MDRQSDKITALYCRVDKPFCVSSDGDIAQAQIDRLSQYAEEHGLTNTELFCDWGFSGTTLDRPEYNWMLRMVAIGKVQALVILDLSRLLRSSVGTMEYMGDFFLQHGVTIHSVKDGGDITEKFMQVQKSVIELYRQNVERGQG